MPNKEEILQKINLLKEKKRQLETIEQFQDTQQHAYKIFLNSAYGALGSQYYSCYDVDNAMSITKSGQTAIKEMIRYTEDKLSKMADSNVMQFVVAGDTDSTSKDALIDVDSVYKLTYNGKTLFIKDNDMLTVIRNSNKVVCTIKDLKEDDQLIWE